MRPVTLGTVTLLALLSAGTAWAGELEDLIIDRANDWSNELGGHLRNVTGDVLDLTFDVRKMKAHVGLGAGGAGFGLHLSGDCKVRDGYLRVRASLGVNLAGAAVLLALPPVDMAPEDMFGHRQVIVRIPLFEQRF